MMNTRHAPAIVMRVKEFRESDLLVTFFTPDAGRLTGIAKGARRSQRRFVNCLDIFCLVNLEYEVKRPQSLCLLHSGRLIEAFAALRRDFAALSLASYMIELTEVLFPPEMGDCAMFELLKGAFYVLEQGGEPGVLRMLFEARAMALGGYAIDLGKCKSCGRSYAGEGRAVFMKEGGGIVCLKCEQETSLSPGLNPLAVQWLQVAQENPWHALKTLTLSNDLKTEIASVLKLHLERRLGRGLKSAQFLN